MFKKIYFIPNDSTSKYEAGVALAVALDESPFGIVASRSYPNFEPGVSYSMKLVTQDYSKAVRIYIVDLNIEDGTLFNPDCTQTRLEFNDGVSVIIF